MRRVVLAYSGSLDTALCVHHLRHDKGFKVYTFSANLGQAEVLEPLAEEAVRLGAAAAHLADLRETFVQDYVFPCIRANAVYEQGYYLFSALARPLLVKELVAIAEEEGCNFVAHGSRGIGNDRRRFENSIQALAPSMGILTPLAELGLRTPHDDMEYARRHGIPWESVRDTVYNLETNLWGNNVQIRDLPDAWEEPPRDTYFMTTPASEAPTRPTVLEIGFQNGNPVCVDGEELRPARLVETLNEIGGRNAVGRMDVVENRISGIKTRELYESPAAVILLAAHRALEAITLEKDVLHFKEALSQQYASLVYEGKWFRPVREGLDSFFLKINERVTGAVRVSLCRGSLSITGRKSPHSLFDPGLAHPARPGRSTTPRR